MVSIRESNATRLPLLHLFQFDVFFQFFCYKYENTSSSPSAAPRKTATHNTCTLQDSPASYPPVCSTYSVPLIQRRHRIDPYTPPESRTTPCPRPPPSAPRSRYTPSAKAYRANPTTLPCAQHRSVTSQVAYSAPVASRVP